MLIGVLVFPAGWDSPAVKEVCGADTMSYSPGQCGIRWAYILAMIGVVDCIVLSVLAFILGSRYVRSLPEQYLTAGIMAAAAASAGGPGSIYKGEFNGAFLPDGGSRKSSIMGPVMVLPGGMGMGQSLMDPERFSEYSHRTGRSVTKTPANGGGFGNGTHFSVNNFQL